MNNSCCGLSQFYLSWQGVETWDLAKLKDSISLEAISGLEGQISQSKSCHLASRTPLSCDSLCKLNIIVTRPQPLDMKISKSLLVLGSV